MNDSIDNTFYEKIKKDQVRAQSKVICLFYTK